MLGSTVLEVAAGLALIYFLLSTIASHVNELISGLLNLRADDLERGLKQLLVDRHLADRVMDNQLVAGLAMRKRNGDRRVPSYIPARTFALALLNELEKIDREQSAARAAQPAPDPQPAPAGPTQPAPAGPAQPVGISGDVKQIRRAAAAISDPAVSGALVTMIDGAQGDITKVRGELEAWFDAAMDRVSGAYKRRAQWIILAIATVVSVGLGVDTLAVASALAHDQGLRDVVTGAAQSASAANLQDAIKQVSNLGLPLGWGQLPGDVQGWLARIAGLAITILAVSLGAPFWFDLLKLFTNPRQTGPKPADSASDAPGTAKPRSS